MSLFTTTNNNLTLLNVINVYFGFLNVFVYIYVICKV